MYLVPETITRLLLSNTGKNIQYLPFYAEIFPNCLEIHFYFSFVRKIKKHALGGRATLQEKKRI